MTPASGVSSSCRRRPRTRGVVVVIHGGYWRSQYGAELGEPLARDLAVHGMPAWNLEYRRAGNGGGWPHTFEDVLAGIDKLRDVAGIHGLGLDKVVALGHSAGGHLAVWAAGRTRLGQLGAPDADRQLQRKNDDDGAVQLTGVVSQAGLLNLAAGRKAQPQQRRRLQPAGRLVGKIPEAPQIRRPDERRPAAGPRLRRPRQRRRRCSREPVRILRRRRPGPRADPSSC